MELQFDKTPCSYLHRGVWQMQEQEQTQELRISDGMPDIGSVVGAWGQCILRSKEWRGDQIGASGGVMARVLYAPADSQQLQVVECWLPVSPQWEMPESQNEGTIRTAWQLKSVDARMLSARKMMVRANVQVLAEALEPRQTELYQPPQMPEDVQLLHRTYPVLMPAEAGEKAFTVEDEIDFGGQPLPETLISVEVQAVGNEHIVVGGKAVFRGDLQLRLLYLGEDGMAHGLTQSFPFSQFSDLDKDYDKSATLCVIYAITNLEPDLSEGKLRVKASIVAQYLVYEQMMVKTVEDAYSPWRKLDCTYENMDLPMELDRKALSDTVYARFDAAPARIVDGAMYSYQGVVRHNGDETQIENRGMARLLYYDANGALRCDNMRFENQSELPIGENTQVMMLVQPQIMPVRISESQQGVMLEGTLDTQMICAGKNGLMAVFSVAMGDKQPLDPSRPSVVVQKTDGGSLWELAKRNGSTMAAIMQANGLTDEPVPGQMLLIPVI